MIYFDGGSSVWIDVKSEIGNGKYCIVRREIFCSRLLFDFFKVFYIFLLKYYVEI